MDGEQLDMRRAKSLLVHALIERLRGNCESSANYEEQAWRAPDFTRELLCEYLLTAAKWVANYPQRRREAIDLLKQAQPHLSGNVRHFLEFHLVLAYVLCMRRKIVKANLSLVAARNIMEYCPEAVDQDISDQYRTYAALITRSSL